MVLGAAWESVDIFDALSLLLRRRRKATVAFLSGLRAVELLDAGGRPLGSVDREKLADPLHHGLMGPGARAVQNKYRQLRAEAEAWHRQRTEFMLARLSAGRHPDTDSHFWDGYRESPPPTLAPSWSEWLAMKVLTPQPIAEALILLSLSVLAGVTLVKRLRRSRRLGRFEHPAR